MCGSSVFGDADATVPDFNANIVAGSPASQQNSSPVGVSDRIRQQVADHLREHVPVAADDEPGTDDAQPQPSFLHRRGEVSSERLEDFARAKTRSRMDAGFRLPACSRRAGSTGCWSWCPASARFQRRGCVPHRLGGAAQALPAGVSGSAMAVASHGLRRPESSIWRDRPIPPISTRAKAPPQNVCAR